MGFWGLGSCSGRMLLWGRGAVVWSRTERLSHPVELYTSSSSTSGRWRLRLLMPVDTVDKSFFKMIPCPQFFQMLAVWVDGILGFG